MTTPRSDPAAFRAAAIERAAAWLWRRGHPASGTRQASEAWTWLPPSVKRQWLEDAAALVDLVLGTEP